MIERRSPAGDAMGSFGITDDDRRRMVEILEQRRKHGCRHGRPGSVMPAADDPIVEEARRELAVLKHINRIDHTKARYLASKLDITPEWAGKVLERLEREGVVSRSNPGGEQ